LAHRLIDEDTLTWGQSFPAALQTTIQSEVDFLVIFLDDEAMNSKWVMQELEWAIQREAQLKRTFVLPILLDAIAPEKLPAGLSERLYLVGRENVMAGSDCGFGTWVGQSAVDPDVVWAKMAAMAEGARIASRQFWK
jgi:hypothetical protein